MRRIQLSLQSYLRVVPALVFACFAGLLNSPVFAAQLQIPGFYGGTATISDTQLPVPQVSADSGKYDIFSTGSNMTVDQQQERVVIDWKSFDIGKNASVHFDQKKSSWAALNRIYDTKSSQILGKLSADGKVYLINQNGILFGPDSQVNVHSLVASALNLQDVDPINHVFTSPEEGLDLVFEDYLTGSAYDDGEPYVLPAENQVAVSNYGTISTADGGAVYLIGPTVENYGDITAPFGQIALAGGSEFQLTHRFDKVAMSSDTGDHDFDIDSDGIESGKVVNGRAVVIDADGKQVEYKGTLKTYSGDIENNDIHGSGGFVGLMGRTVRHDGVIRSVTSLLNKGVVELRARDSIVTGQYGVSGVSGEEYGLIDAVINSSGEALVDTEALRDDGEPFGAEVTFGGLSTSEGPPSEAEGAYKYRDSVDIIDHHGKIIARSGEVNMYADRWIYLEGGSSIDVSGVWASRSGDSNEIEAQLNSFQLRDEDAQQGGSLQGKTISFNALLGSNMGDVSGYLSAEEKTAVESATKGGKINLWVGVDENEEQVNSEINEYSNGDVIVSDSAEINFSGGGVLYDSGYLQTTKLLAPDGKIYDISEAPDNISDYRTLTLQTLSNPKYGNTTLSGLYYGGATSLYSYVGPYIQGSDAGSLSLIGPTVTLNGILNGLAVNGPYQTEEDDPTYEYDDDSVVAVGRAKAVKGILTVGNRSSSYPSGRHRITDKIVLTEHQSDLSEVETTSAEEFVDDLYAADTSELLISTIENAQLSAVNLYSNTSVSVDESAAVKLEGDSSFSATSSLIAVDGEIYAPGGTINLTLDDSYLYDDGGDADVIDRMIYLGPESVLSTAGEQVDNSAAKVTGNAEEVPVYMEGGSITLSDDTVYGFGVYAAAGSLIDVSGGYYIDQSGDLTAADAGEINVQGHSVVLDGELSGVSLVGHDGGSINLHASEVEITAREVAQGGATDALSAVTVLKELAYEEDGNRFGSLVLNHNRFSDGGFSHISLVSTKDLTVDENVLLIPSTVKKLAPESETVAVAGYRPSSSMSDDIHRIDLDELEDSSITLKAGFSEGSTNANVNLNFTNSMALTLATGSQVEVAPRGMIALEAPNINIDAVVSAPSGKIDIKQAQYATEEGGETEINGGQLNLFSNARILAQGYNREVVSSLSDTLTDFSPLGGGTVSLESWGTLDMQDGALIDVSAAEPVTRTLMVSGILTEVQDGADGGTVDIDYYAKSDFDFGGKLQAGTSLSGYQGGELDIYYLSSVMGSRLDLYQGDIDIYVAAGFDSLAFGAKRTVYLADQIDFELPGTLRLDAPRIESLAGLNHRLQARWLEISNSNEPFANSVAEQDTSLSLIADWIDVDGSVVFSGFDDVSLTAAKAISLSDVKYYLSGGNQVWEGRLETEADLTLSASVVYPTRNAHFIVDSAGILTVKRPESFSDVDVLSAGGQLTLQAQSIDYSGFVRAPLGQIALNADENIFVASTGKISVSSDYVQNYGFSVEDADSSSLYHWKAYTKSEESPNETVTVNGALDSSVTLTAGDDGGDGGIVLVQSGAEIDISGGGGLTRSYFLPGTDGTVDPLDDTQYSNRYVVVPGIDLIVPGAEESGLMIEVRDSDLLAAGTYYVLPDEYAYLPGAVVVEATGRDMVSTNLNSSVDGQAVTAGTLYQYGGQATGVQEVFTLYLAEDLIGDSYTTDTITAGDAGALNFDANTVILEGSLAAHGLSGYDGGALTLEAGNVNLTASEAGGTFDLVTFDTVSDAVNDLGVIGGALISDNFLSDSGLNQADLSAKGSGENTIRVESGAVVRLDNVRLNAEDRIVVEENALLEANEGGAVALTTPALRVEQGATVKGPMVTLDIDDLDLFGSFLSDSGTLNVSADVLYLVDENYTVPSDGVFLTENLTGFTGFSSVYLKSDSDLIFVDGVNLTGLDVLSIDAARLVSASGSVYLNASQVSLQNLQGASAGGYSSGVTGADLTIDADQLLIGPSHVEADQETIAAVTIDDGFATVNLKSRGDLIFAGKSHLVAEGAGSMTLEADRLVVTHNRDTDNDTLTNGKAVIDAGSRNLSLVDVNPSASSDNSDIIGAGSILEVSAATVTSDSDIVAKAGLVKISATGDIKMAGSIDVSGIEISGTVNEQSYSESYDAGTIVLTSSGGDIDLQNGSSLDVSAGGADNAGTLVLNAVSGSVALNGALAGSANGGLGGSFGVHSGAALNLDALTDLLMFGGFSNVLEIETHAGDLLLSGGKLLSADSVVLAASGGALTIAGTIDVSGDEAGDIELWANNDLSVTGSLLAVGADEGGSVKMSSENGTVVLGSATETALIDVKDNDSGTSGTVYLRARSDQIADGIAGSFNVVNADVDADRVKVEGFVREERSAVDSGTVDVNDVDGLIDAADNDENDIVTEFASIADGDTTVTFVPGAEITRTGTLDVSAMTLNAANAGSDAGALALRASDGVAVAGDIISSVAGSTIPTVDTDLLDYNPFISFIYSALGDSWNISMTAGADLASADLARTQLGIGDLTIAAGSLIYTESGALSLAAGDDIVVGKSSLKGYTAATDMYYSIGTFAGDIRIASGNDINLSAGAAIQSAVGDIFIDVGRNLSLGNKGAIRSIGSTLFPTGFTGDWTNFFTVGNDLSGRGGDIDLIVSGSVLGKLNDDHWYQYVDNNNSNFSGSMDFTSWDEGEKYLDFVVAKQAGASGIISSGGGDISGRVYGDFTGQAGSFYWYRTDTDETSNLELRVGGNLDGRFHVYAGQGLLSAGGNFGTSLAADSDDDENGLIDQVLEAFDAQYVLSALGDINLGAMVNPTLADTSLGLRYMSFSQRAALTTTSIFGDTILTGRNDASAYGSNDNAILTILPASVAVRSGRDLKIENAGFVLMPSASGYLTLLAKDNIDGFQTSNSRSASIKMLGSLTYDNDNFYGSWSNWSNTADMTIANVSGVGNVDGLLHSGENESDPIVVAAGKDITDIQFWVPKSADVSAGRDIINLELFAQNIGADGSDVTKVSAGRDLTFTPAGEASRTGIAVAGTGSLIVQVGETLDLGTSKTGIRTTAQKINFRATDSSEDVLNYDLGEGGDLVVLVGADIDWTAAEAKVFFEDLRLAAKNYSIANAEGFVTLADGEEYTAAEIAEKTRREVIAPLFDGVVTREGQIEMALSTIQTRGADSDLYLVSTGGVNVGQSAFDDSSDTGIMTGDTSDIEILRDNNGNIVYDQDGYVQYNVLDVVRDDDGKAVLSDDGEVQYKLKDGGSDINIYAVGDIDVLESRIMTQFGSDIVIWCDKGDVNAGRGSTTALSAGKPVVDEYKNTIGYEAPSLGSGIRALSYDRDGESGSDPAPIAGDVYVAVPEGVLDAGEAGIRGNSVILGATEVRNAQNISFSAGSVGVPVSTGSVSGLGNVSGDGAASEMAKIANDTANLGQDSLADGVAIVDDFIAKWIEAKVIGYPDTF